MTHADIAFCLCIYSYKTIKHFFINGLKKYDTAADTTIIYTRQGTTIYKKTIAFLPCIACYSPIAFYF
jgi:hypothetical protein